MNINKVLMDKIEALTNKIDYSLILYINRYITDDMSTLEKAVSIYLLLGDVLCYSPSFSLNPNYDVLSSIGNVNIENNQINCKTWSILYYRLLKYYGINSKVVSKKGHYKVLIEYNNVIYQADATGYGAYGISYSMSDIARIKFNFKIEKFIVKSTSLDGSYDSLMEQKRVLCDVINNVYMKQNRKVYSDNRISGIINVVMSLIERNKDIVGLGSLEDIEYRIKIINRFWSLNIKNSPLEKMQLFNNFFKIVFCDLEELESRCYNLYSFVNGNYIIYKLIVVEIDDVFYYYLDDGSKFTYYSKIDLLEEFRNRNIIIHSGLDIIGIYSGFEKYKK